MSLNETELALAVMDDDGWGCAITSAPEPPGIFLPDPAWTVHIRPVIGCTGCEDSYNRDPGQWRGCAITRAPEPGIWTITVRLTGVRAPTADSALNRISARLAGPEFGRTLQARAEPAHITEGT